MSASRTGKRGHAGLSPDVAAQAGSQKYHEVYLGDRFSGRRFTSLVSAQRYAKTVGGSVRTV